MTTFLYIFSDADISICTTYCFKEEGCMGISAYQEKLIKIVIDNSYGHTWKEAVGEWEIIDCIEDGSRCKSCVCGKEELRYLYRIHNRLTDRYLYPIGSSCIRKFEREDLQDKTSIAEGMFKLLHAVEKNEYLKLSSELFSRKLLRALYEKGAFEANSYNNYDASSDYKFMLKMFNMRNKSKITPLQDKKIKAILLNSIKPFLQNELKNKVIRYCLLMLG